MSVGCLCHCCDLGRHYHERRDLGEKHFLRFIPLIERRDLQHEIFRYPEETRIWAAEREGYCNPRYNLEAGQVKAWWAKYKTRLARVNKERRNEPGNSQSSQNGSSSLQDASTGDARPFAQELPVDGTLAP